MKNVTLILMLLFGKQSTAQFLHHLKLSTQHSQYFSPESEYSSERYIWNMPGIQHIMAKELNKSLSWYFGWGLQMVPIMTVSRFNTSDTILRIPEEFKFNETNKTHWISDFNLNVSIPIGLILQSPNEHHNFVIGFNPFFTVIKHGSGGIGTLGAIPGTTKKERYNSFYQFYNFRPDGVIGFRMSLDYQYHFKLYGQTFFTTVGGDFLLSNIPVVDFEVYNFFNDNPVLVTSFQKHFPRLYGNVGLGILLQKRKST